MPARIWDLPPLPAPPEGLYIAWPPSVEASYRFIQATHQQARRLLRLHNGDIARLKIVKGTLETEALLTLEKLEILGLPSDFVDGVMTEMAEVVVELEATIERLKDT
ncbi:hypothetical protein FRC07_013939, partial [Ceratobasidium sp. 392]